jgi:hypothetical protein
MSKKPISEGVLKQKCIGFLTNNPHRAILRVYDGGRPHMVKDIEFVSHKVNFPQIRIVIPDNDYQILMESKRYRLTIGDQNQSVYTPEDVVFIPVPPSIDTGGQQKTLFLSLKGVEILYTDRAREIIGEKLCF